MDIIDSPSSNLLQFLPKVTKFIEKAIEVDSGVVFVHCVHGQSRSCAVCVAYLIDISLRNKLHGGDIDGQINNSMSEQGHMNVLHACYDQVIESRQQMAINPGFVKQLDIFCKMKNLQLSRLSATVGGGEEVMMKKPMLTSRAFAYHRSFRAKTQFYHTGTISSQFCPLLLEKAHKIYKCKNCQMILFSDTNIIDDWTEDELSNLPASDYWKESQGGLDYMKLYSSDKRGGEQNYNFQVLLTQKSKIHKVEPMKWMEPLLKSHNGNIFEISGNINCPVCSTLLGYWDWLNDKDLAVALIILKNKTIEC